MEPELELKKGEWVKCTDEVDVRKKLAILSAKGYGAVRCVGNYIMITREPEDREAV